MSDTTPKVGDLVTGQDRSFQRSIYRVMGFGTAVVRETRLRQRPDGPVFEEVNVVAENAPCFLMLPISYDGHVWEREDDFICQGLLAEYRLATEAELREEQIRIMIEKGRSAFRPAPQLGGKAQSTKSI